MEPKEKWEQLKREHKKEEKDKLEEIKEFEETEPQIMTQEEKQRVKKELMGLIWLILIIIIGIILFLVVSGLIKKEEKQTNNNQVEEEKLPEPLEDGEIDVSNETIQEIDKMISFNINNPLYEENILNLFNTEKVKIEDFNFQTKMFLITSNSIFYDYMLEKTDLKNYQNKEVSLTKDELEELSKKIFGRDINLEHNNFKYYYETKEKVTYFDVTLEDDKYTFTETTGSPSNIRLDRKMIEAYKIGKNVYVRYKYIFISETGIYSDVNMKNLLSSNRYDANLYLDSGQVYEFIYTSNDLKYNLDYIEKAFRS